MVITYLNHSLQVVRLWELIVMLLFQRIMKLIQTLLKELKMKRKKSGAIISETNDPKEAVKNADIIYTDVWTSMGWQGDKTERLKEFEGFQVDEELVKYAKDDYIFMHCLPAIRGEEVAAEIIDGENSVVFNQAENRLHAQKSVMATSM